MPANDHSKHRYPPPYRHSSSERRDPPKMREQMSFSFYLRDRVNEKGLAGAVFELFAHHQTGRIIAISNQHGKVHFSVIVGDSYVLFEKTPPADYYADPNFYTICLTPNGLLVDGKEMNELVLHNHQESGYSILYDANGGTGKSLHSGFEHDEAYKVQNADQSGIHRADHLFFAWNTSPDGTEKMYLPGDVLKFQRDITLFAQWTPIPSIN